MHILANKTFVCFAPKPTREVGFSWTLPRITAVAQWFVACAGLNRAQSESRWTACPPGRNTNQNVISYNFTPCLYWWSKRTAPSLVVTQTTVPARHPVVPHTSHLPAPKIRDANRPVCFPLQPQQHWTWNSLRQTDTLCGDVSIAVSQGWHPHRWEPSTVELSPHCEQGSTELSCQLFLPTSSLEMGYSGR